MAVGFSEVAGYPQETWGEEEFTAVTQLLCAWGDRHTLVGELAAGGGLAYPHNGDVGAKARSCTIEPFGEKQTNESGSWSAYDSALVTVNFSNKFGEGEAFAAESLEPNVEFMTLPYEDFRWGSVSGAEIKSEEAPGKQVHGMTYNVDFYNVSSIPAGALSCIGGVNNATFTPYTLGITFAAGTLLFTPPRMDRQLTMGEPSHWKVSYSFLYRPSGWNTFWNASAGAWQSLYHIDGGGSAYTLYPAVDFSAIVPS